MNNTRNNSQNFAMINSSLSSKQLSYEKKRDVHSLAKTRSRRGRSLSARLEAASTAYDSDSALNHAYRLRECSRPENHWIAHDLQDKNGAFFDGVGVYADCGSFLCPNCSEMKCNRNLHKAKIAVVSYTLRTDEGWWLLTLTSTTVKKVGLTLILSVYQRAWSLLRKRKYWKECVYGGVKDVEWTTKGKDASYHVHIHLLVVSKNIKIESLRGLWTDAICEAWKERGVTLEINTTSGFAKIDARVVRAFNKRAGRSSQFTSGDQALQIICRYLCKSKKIWTLPDEQLVEIAELGRWPRLFEVFGIARVALKEASLPLVKNKITDAPVSDSTSQLSKAKRVNDIRHIARTVDRSTLQTILNDRFASRRQYREAALPLKFPHATFETLSRSKGKARNKEGQTCLNQKYQ